MIPKAVEAITFDGVAELAGSGLREGRDLDFKRDLVGTKDDDKREFLADVSSFANTIGGDLLFGTEEANGEIVGVPGIELEDPDAEIRRLDSILRTGLEPRLPSLDIRWLGADGKRGLLLVRVSRSWIAPHRVIFREHAKFYGRNSAGKYPLDVAELRMAFTNAESIPERIRHFRQERLETIARDETPLPLHPGVKLLLHIVPLSAFVAPLNLQVGSRAEILVPLGSSSGFNFQHALEGFVTYSGPEGGIAGVRAYTLLFRNGIVEAVAAITFDTGSHDIAPSDVEGPILDAFQNYYRSLTKFGIEPPFYVFLSLTNVRGFRLAGNRWHSTANQIGLRRNTLLFPEVFVENPGVSPEILFRPTFDLFWNAFGYAGAFSFDKNGRYVGRER